jgi:hypothetical protein
MIDEDSENLDDFEIPELNVSDIINNLSSYDVVKLCDMIICHRYLGFNKEIAVACMEELGRRRINGDQFDFEGYIEREFRNLPKIEIALPDLRTALNQAINSSNLK